MFIKRFENRCSYIFVHIILIKVLKDELEILKQDCFCRKPNPGLFFEQAFLRNINLKESLMIGDSDNDFFAAKNAGCNFLNVNDL